MTNSPRYTTFSLRASKVHQKTIFSLQNDWILPTSEALEVKTVNSRELIMIFNVVYNVVSDIIHFDQNTVRSNLKELCKI